MSDSGGWDIKRHLVCLCGLLLKGDGSGAAGAKVTITDGPKKFMARVKSGRAGSDAGAPHQISPNVTRVRPDGIFFFLDLPEGDYTVTAEGARAHEHAGNHGKVVRKKDGSTQRAVLDMTFPSR